MSDENEGEYAPILARLGRGIYQKCKEHDIDSLLEHLSLILTVLAVFLVFEGILNLTLTVSHMPNHIRGFVASLHWYVLVVYILKLVDV